MGTIDPIRKQLRHADYKTLHNRITRHFIIFGVESKSFIDISVSDSSSKSKTSQNHKMRDYFHQGLPLPFQLESLNHVERNTWF